MLILRMMIKTELLTSFGDGILRGGKTQGCPVVGGPVVGGPVVGGPVVTDAAVKNYVKQKVAVGCWMGLHLIYFTKFIRKKQTNTPYLMILRTDNTREYFPTFVVFLKLSRGD